MKYRSDEFCKIIRCALRDTKQCSYCKAYQLYDYLRSECYEILKIRPFTAWAAEQLEGNLIRNDERGKGPWETASEQYLINKIAEEYDEVIEAVYDCCVEESRTPERVAHLQYELSDLSVTCMMLSARLDTEMSELRRGYREVEKG